MKKIMTRTATHVGASDIQRQWFVIAVRYIAFTTGSEHNYNVATALIEQVVVVL